MEKIYRSKFFLISSLIPGGIITIIWHTLDRLPKLQYLLIWVWFIITLTLCAIVDHLSSKWIEPDYVYLRLSGYKFLRDICPGNKPEYTSYQNFLAGGGDKDLFFSIVGGLLLNEEEFWLRPLCIIGGFPDIKDWKNLPLETRMSILKTRWIFKMKKDID